jgi:hypothetical protein
MAADGNVLGTHTIFLTSEHSHCAEGCMNKIVFPY